MRVGVEEGWSERDTYTGTWRIPYSNNAYAYSTIQLPVYTIGKGPGPTVLVTGGNHGDEFIGQVVARRLINTLTQQRMLGKLIVLPSLNLPAALASERSSPIDGLNMNRSFPGNPNGAPTEMIADCVEREILPQCDYAIDIHSGGWATRYIPCGFIRFDSEETSTQRNRKLEAARVLAFPHTLVVSAKGSDDRSLSAACDRNGVTMLAMELDGGGAVPYSLVNRTLGAVLRVLEHWGIVLDEDIRTSYIHETRFVHLPGGSRHVMSTNYGLFEPTRELGESIRIGEELGRIYKLESSTGEYASVLSPDSGTIVIQRIPPVVRPGDFLYSLGTEFDPDN